MLQTKDDEYAQVVDDGNLKRLKKTRDGNRAKATKLINQACEFMNDRKIYKDVLNKLQVIARSLSEKKEYLVQLDNKILQKCTLDKLDEEVDESTDIGTRINDFMLRVLALHSNHKLKSTSTFSTQSVTPSFQSIYTASTNSKQRIL